MGWEEKVEAMRRELFGFASNVPLEERSQQPGWFCAQRRPGRALGWLQEMYHNPDDLPDILIIADDDTSVDIEKVKRVMRSQNHLSAAGCVFRQAGFSFSFGGFGTFISKPALEVMTKPIYCDQRMGEDPHLSMVCENLMKNQIGELDSFTPGDTVFDLFYKYSARKDFCLHSDWATGYMLSMYSGANMGQARPRKCRNQPCDRSSITCHNHGPVEMRQFMLEHPQPFSGVTGDGVSP